MRERVQDDNFRLGVSSFVTGLAVAVTCRSKEAILTSDWVFHWLTASHSASPILLTAPVPDPRLSHAELGPSMFVFARSQRRSCLFGQRFPPVEMKLREMSAQVQVFGLESALFSVFDLIQLVICHRVIEIGVGVIRGIEIQDVTSGGGPISGDGG